MNTETIVAIATPMGNGGIGIIKMSGTKSLSIASSVFQFSENALSLNQKRFSSLKRARKIYYGRIVNQDTGTLIDEALLLVMPAPRSYTREDVVEIQTHGGIAVLNKVLDLLIQQGARMAEPGEFTKRAFLNGRIDLTQAEAVMDIINAGNELAMNIAANQISGSLGNMIKNIAKTCEEVMVEGEAAIDFPEDVGDLYNPQEVTMKLEQNVLRPLENLIQQYFRNNFIRNGIKAVIVGRPNVGKSSLMNRLLKKDRVIVSEIPGTTRDFIEAPSFIKNLQVVFTDTAGLHKSREEIENIGIKKTYQYIAEADLVLFVVDLKSGIGQTDVEIFQKIKHKNIIMVLNKMDLAAQESLSPENKEMANLPRVRISAKYNQGIGGLEEKILSVMVSEESKNDSMLSVSPNPRQYQAIKNARECIKTCIEAIQKGASQELWVLDLKEATGALDEVLGRTSSMDVLDKIFEQFCIGK